MNDFEGRYRSWHTMMSFIKSGIRLVACVFGMVALPDAIACMYVLAGGFFLAEIVGIAEEYI